MNKTISPSAGLKGRIKIPGDKSISQSSYGSEVMSLQKRNCSISSFSVIPLETSNRAAKGSRQKSSAISAAFSLSVYANFQFFLIKTVSPFKKVIFHL